LHLSFSIPLTPRQNKESFVDEKSDRANAKSSLFSFPNITLSNIFSIYHDGLSIQNYTSNSLSDNVSVQDSSVVSPSNGNQTSSEDKNLPLPVQLLSSLSPYCLFPLIFPLTKDIDTILGGLFSVVGNSAISETMKKFGFIDFFIYLIINVILFVFIIKGSKSSLSSGDQITEAVSTEDLSEKDLEKQKAIMKDKFSYSLINNNASDEDVCIIFF
jgi:hypothetical protein